MSNTGKFIASFLNHAYNDSELKELCRIISCMDDCWLCDSCTEDFGKSKYCFEDCSAFRVRTDLLTIRSVISEKIKNER